MKNVTSLQNSTLSEVSVVNLKKPTNDSPDSEKKNVSTGAVVAGAVLGTIAFFSLIVLTYIYLKKQKCSKNINSSDLKVQEIKESPITHRISVTEDTSLSTTHISIVEDNSSATTHTILVTDFSSTLNPMITDKDL